MDPSSQRQFPRAPISVKVNLEFEKFSGFISEYAMNISEGGIFIRTDDPKPMGTILSFEFRLADNFKLIQGLGEVVWVREQSLSPAKPKGMGIHFHELDSRSRELIRTIVDRHVREGGRPFELETEAAPSPPAAAEIPPAAAGPNVSLDNLFRKPLEPGSPLARPSTADATEIADGSAGVEEDFRALFKAGEADPPAEEKPPRKDMGIVMEEEETPPPDLTERLEPENAIFSSEPEPGGKLKWILIFVALLLVAGAAYWFFFLRKPEAVRVPPPRVMAVSTAVPAPAVTAAPVTTAVPAARPTEAPSAPAQATLAPPTPIPDTPTPAPPTPTPPFPEPTVAPTAVSAPDMAAPPAPKAPPVILPGALITQITWTQSAIETVFRLSSDREITFDQVQHVRITEEPAREVIKIRGIREKFRAYRMNVAGPHVKQIRTGFHVFPGRGDLHIVFDLTSPRAQITKVDTSPSGVTVRFENR